ncbi:MAG: ATP-binding protein [Anaerolineae bacterium]|nr:ATP-binding protein [Anaerolineae bacterium]
MNQDELRTLLAQPEGPKLDFKQELTIYHTQKEVRDWSRDELIKDLLALANGNTLVAGQPGYLIFGAADELPANGTRELFDVTGRIPTRTDILDILNRACYPRIEDIDVQIASVDDKQLLVITVPPTPHLHQTIRELKTAPTKTYSPSLVFTRHNEEVQIALDKERFAIREAKQHYFRQQRTVKPAPFAAIYGSVVLGMIGWSASERDFGTVILARMLMVLILGGIGAFTGWVFGLGWDQFLETKQNWHRYSILKKILLVTYVVIAIGLILRSCL